MLLGKVFDAVAGAPVGVRRCGGGVLGGPDSGRAVGVVLRARRILSELYGELPRRKCSCAYSSTPMSRWPASMAMLSAVLPSWNNKPR